MQTCPNAEALLETASEDAGNLGDKDIAIVHDWLPELSGIEKVIFQMTRCFPKATLYTLFDFLSPEERAELSKGCPVHVSRLNAWPGVKSYHRYLLLHCTRAIEEFDVTGHELVLSSSAVLAKGVITSPDQEHFAYVHSPARYAWELTYEYTDSIGGAAAAIKKRVAHKMMQRFRIWDRRTAPWVDHSIANSDFIRERIWKDYRREADVIYPPVNTDGFAFNSAARGEQQPIEVMQIGEGRYGLILGWRRCQAIRALTEDGQHNGTMLALLRQPSEASEAYPSMVEESEIRVDPSYFERAQIAKKAIEQGVFETKKAALLALFASASRPKRSKIRALLPIVTALDGVLRFSALDRRTPRTAPFGCA